MYKLFRLARGLLRLAVIAAVANLLAACTSAEYKTQRSQAIAAAQIKDTIVIKNLSAYAQTDALCGPTSLATLLNHRGLNVKVNELVDKLFIEKRRGALQTEMVAQARAHALLAYADTLDLNALFAALDAGTPLLVLMDIGAFTKETFHFAVVGGYNPTSDEVLLYMGYDKPKWVNLSTFYRWWQGGRFWGLAAIPPQTMPAFVKRDVWLNAAVDLSETNQVTAAESAFRSAMRRWPTHAYAIVGLANIRYGQERYEEALRLFQAAISKVSTPAAILTNIAWCEFKLGHYSRAQRTVTRVKNYSADTTPEIVTSIQHLEQLLNNMQQ